MLGRMKEGVAVCVTVTLIDGLVLARSVFNHSMNYRSVVILGKATLVEDREEKLISLRLLSEHIIPGRWDDARQPNERELKATSVLRIPIEEYSAKFPHMGWSHPARDEGRRGDWHARTKPDRGDASVRAPLPSHEVARPSQ
jgi:nitroimidazol reductase NimA-like FMN-containing flavoprotein (pyridoxamine 5'-phosphate oxidase superfamily)